MAHIIVPSRMVLTRQPDASARITDSTLAESLLTAWLPHTSPMIDIVTGGPLDDPYAGSSFHDLVCDETGEFSRGNNNSTLYRSFGRLSRVSYDGWSQLLIVRPLAEITTPINISYLFGASSWNSSEIWVGRDGVSQFSYRTVGGGSLSVNAGPYTLGKRYVLVGVSRTTGTEFWMNGQLVGTTASVYGNKDYSRCLAIFSPDATANRMRFIGGAAWARALRKSEAAALSENPWQIFRPRRRITFFDYGAGSGSSLNATASGQAQASGAAQLAANVALAGIGVAVAGGQAAAAVAVPLAASGLAVSGGNADATATVTLSAAGLAAAAGQAGLSAAVLLAGAGAAQAAGNATLAAQLNALAAGAAQADGSANLTGGSQGQLAAQGGSSSSGQAALTITISLQAAGSASSSGTAAANVLTQGGMAADGKSVASGTAAPTVRIAATADGQAQAGGLATGAIQGAGQITAIGNAQASGAATYTVTATLTAAGFVQAMGAARLAVEIPLAALGAASASGSASLTQVPDYVPAMPLSLNAAVTHRTILLSTAARTIKLNHEVRRAYR